MPRSEAISREEWLRDLQDKCPSSEAFDAYLAVETFIREHTPLAVSYRRGPGGHATFCASATGPGRSCCVVQILRGYCEVMGQWIKPIPGLSSEQHSHVNESFLRLRRALDGSPNKGYQRIKVLSLGVERVNNALFATSNELVELLKTDEFSE